MKYKPISPSNPAREKTKYIVTIEDEEFTTSAFTEGQALSNACFRYAEEMDEDVALIKWQVKHEKLYSNVEEI